MDFAIFGEAVEKCNGQASLFIEDLLSNLEQDSVVFWMFKYYTTHFKAQNPVDGIVDSNFETKQIEWVHEMYRAMLDISDVDFESDNDPLHDDIQCVYLYALLCRNEPWTDKRIHPTWRVLYEGNNLMQRNENNELVGNPNRAIHQRVAKKMMFMTSLSSAKRLLSIIGGDFVSLMEHTSQYMSALFAYFYMERESKRNQTFNKERPYFGSEYESLHLPSLEEFLDNLVCSKNNEMRREANEPINLLLSSILASSELSQIKRFCTGQAVRLDDSLPLEFSDFNDDVLIAIVHIILLFQFEDMEDLFQKEWVRLLFQHFLNVLVDYDLFAYIPTYYQFAFDCTSEIALFLCRLNFSGVSLEYYRKQVSKVQEKLSHYQFDVESISLTVLQHYLDNLHNHKDIIGLLSVLNWCVEYNSFLKYFNLFMRYLLINNEFDAIERLEMIYGRRVPAALPMYEDYIADVYFLREIYKILQPESKLTSEEANDIYKELMCNYDWNKVLDYGVTVNLDLTNVLSKVLAVIMETGSTIETARLATIELTNNQIVSDEHAEFLIDQMLQVI